MTITSKQSNPISIGGLAAACGVPVETLRNWENRYGFPLPERLESGHRRYALELIPRLRKIRMLVDAGYKPSFAVTASDEEMDRLLLCSSEAASERSGPDTAQISGWLALVEQMDGAGLARAFSRDWNTVGARRFIFEHALPYLRDVGCLWERGAISVAHEHFASEVLQTFLAEQWRPLLPVAGHRRIVLANQEGELHSLGLQMAAILTTLHGVEPVFLGPNTPLRDIIVAATAQKVDAVIIGLSAVSDPARSASFLTDLRQGLVGIRLAFGGNDRLPAMSNIEYIPTLEDFDRWLDLLV